MKKHKLYLYDRNELTLLTLMFAVALLFTFTLGLHLGKGLGLKVAPGGEESAPTARLEGADESLPSREELDSKIPGIDSAVVDALSRTLQEEVAKTGVRLDVPRQVELPKGARSEKLEKHMKVEPAAAPKPSKLEETMEKIDVAKRDETGFAKQIDTSVKPFYQLQIGSYPTEDEANKKAKLLEMAGYQPRVHKSNLGSKGTWYRVLVGEFETTAQAEAYGKEQVKNRSLDSYIVIKKPGE